MSPGLAGEEHGLLRPAQLHRLMAEGKDPERKGETKPTTQEQWPPP